MLIIIFLVIIILIVILLCTIKKNKLDFIHIPKNAGTSIENLGEKYNILWGRFNKNIKVYKNSPCDQFIWHSPYIVKESNKQYFALIRNPYDKLISEFYYMNDLEETTNKEEHIELFRKWFDSIKDDIYWNNCHILPQSKYVYDENNKKVIQHIIYMDKDMNKNLDNLFKKFNLNIDINDLNNDNNTGYKKSFTKEDLDQETLDKIYNMYIDDFKNFKFERIIK
jgi:hypothetical protein